MYLLVSPFDIYLLFLFPPLFFIFRQPQYAQQQQPYAPGTVQQYGQTQYTDPYGARHAYGTNGAVATVTTTSSFGGGLYYNG